MGIAFVNMSVCKAISLTRSIFLDNSKIGWTKPLQIQPASMRIHGRRGANQMKSSAHPKIADVAGSKLSCLVMTALSCYESAGKVRIKLHLLSTTTPETTLVVENNQATRTLDSRML